ncbi:PAS domain-containing protein [Marinobacter orientalis]|uniref:PAS domain S-box protein n=1 Tax=Marinobacter orientalis TaxID=1928859 RepID=A0A7Y0NJS6_9GAMM|nr:PAS domain-containing protein [Marinobacter orientalis]NMT62771.1 PAS domain S-box protein [Marinobacter orientalis]TGX51450.1 PAS domain S-box protein [Marinobacter orientalis]
MTSTHRYPNAESHERLRRSARDLIDHGVPPRGSGGTLSVDALQLLYERASTPESAADARKLLHELQTYQVELDLLYEQLQANEQEISEDLAHYRALFEQAPAPYLVIASDGGIIEGNQAAGALFGEFNTALAGKALSTLLAPGQGATIETLLRTSAEHGTARGSVELPDHRWVTVHARAAADNDGVLIILTEATTDSARF